MAVRSTMTAILVAAGACTSPLAGATVLTSIAPPGFKESPTSFCEHDHALGVPYPNAATVTACAAACTSANGFAFEWNCNGTKAPMCIVFRTASDCGDLKRSGCGTTVRCITHCNMMGRHERSLHAWTRTMIFRLSRLHANEEHQTLHVVRH
jgi:hypothetical protein